jgi:ElaB/YqjD/DUF883 family membrane-anchored ribosome-binding protein
MTTTIDTLQADVRNDVRNLVRDTEELLKVAARTGDDGLGELRQRLEGRLRHLRSRLSDLEAGAAARARAAAAAADHSVRTHPYTAIGIAGIAGLLLGYLVSRR